jgi:osmotically-inducible protein OsmY
VNTSTRPVEADNTARNEQDRSMALPTPLDQGESEQDLAITQAIRKAVMADESLSVDAKNAKIITRDGVVALRGPVANDRERAVLEQLAESTAGVVRVANLLEIKASGY